MRLTREAGADGRSAAIVVDGPGGDDLRRHAAADPDAFASAHAVVPAGALQQPGDVVPMAGRWRADATGLRFLASLPLARNVVHVLVRRGPGDEHGPGWVELARLARADGDPDPTSVVLAIHPDVQEVPANLLRCSVTFSAVMAEGGATGRLHLQDRAGEELAGALLAMPPELWDAGRRRLTLLLDPGRIKRGLAPNRALGAPLDGLDLAELVVDPGVRDAGGGTLRRGASRSYRVGPAVRTRVDPARWTVRWPDAGTVDPLVVGFERPLDRALALRSLAVTDAAGGSPPGAAAVDREDTRWSFSPAAAWPGGPLRLRVDTALEDLAGNSVRRVFDRDLRRADDDPLDAAEVVLTSP